MLYTKSKVSVKYITKNIISEVNELFLAAMNQIIAKTISRMNFRAIPVMLCNAWLSGSLDWPLKKIDTVMIEINEKLRERITRSERSYLISVKALSRYPVRIKNAFNNKSWRIYFGRGFKKVYLIKSLITV